jgi:hypothetical protein
VEIRLTPPPPGILVELVQLRYPLRHRITDDGRYLVTPPGEAEHEEPVDLAWGRSADALAAETLERLRAALRAAGFFALPAELPTLATRGAPLGGGSLEREPLSLGARLDGRAHAVTFQADLRVPRSAGVLEPVLAVLWHDLLEPPGIG